MMRLGLVGKRKNTEQDRLGISDDDELVDYDYEDNEVVSYLTHQ